MTRFTTELQILDFPLDVTTHQFIVLGYIQDVQEANQTIGRSISFNRASQLTDELATTAPGRPAAQQLRATLLTDGDAAFGQRTRPG